MVVTWLSLRGDLCVLVKYSCGRLGFGEKLPFWKLWSRILSPSRPDICSFSMPVHWHPNPLISSSSDLKNLPEGLFLCLQGVFVYVQDQIESKRDWATFALLLWNTEAICWHSNMKTNTMVPAQAMATTSQVGEWRRRESKSLILYLCLGVRRSDIQDRYRFDTGIFCWIGVSVWRDRSKFDILHS